MRVLDLFAGLGGWSGPFRERGHDVTTLDFDPRFGTDVVADILAVESLDDLPGAPFDVVLASPPCEAFSVLGIGRNWTGPNDPDPHQPKTDAARMAAKIVAHTRALIDDHAPAFFIFENPVAKLRKLPMLADLERRTVTYCQLGEPFRKPTDLWGGFPPSLVLPAPCAVTRRTVEHEGRTWAANLHGEPCHVSAPRGSRTGIQGEGVDWTAEYEPDSPHYSKDAAVASRRQQRNGYAGRRDGMTKAALRAKIPDRLALLVCMAAEADLRDGAHAVPGARLF